MGRKVKKKLIEGFSLVELSVVLAIIGLLAGGIVAGQALIKNARLAKVGTTLNNLKLAYNQFKSQYGYFPGDFPLATTIWGRADNGVPITTNCPFAATYNANANPNGTCNGNGDDWVNTSSSDPEQVRGWQQMRLSGLVTGNYTGIWASQQVPEVTNPGILDYNPNGFVEVNGASWYCTGIYAGPIVGCPEAADGNYYGAFTYESYGTSGSMTGGGPAVTPQDAYSLDRKYDDGSPNNGDVRAMRLNSCLAGNEYDVTRNDFQCALIIMNPEAIQSFQN